MAARRVSSPPRLLAAAALALGIQVVLSASSGEVVEREVYLMGTRARLVTVATNRATGLARLEQLLTPLEAGERRLSTWRPDSEISRLNGSVPGRPVPLSAETCALFGELEHWVRESGGTFDPAVGALTAAWDLHGAGRVPSGAELARARDASGFEHLRLDRATCTVTRRAGAGVDVGAFGKGAALDDAAALADPDAAWLVDLGGQIAARGAPAGLTGWSVSVAHPLDRDQPVVDLALLDESIATSGRSERDLWSEGRRIGHILDPRSGRPAPFLGSVTVRHTSALAADVLSTALFVMGPEAGVRWADARGIAALYLVPWGTDGDLQHVATRAFLEHRRGRPPA
jgi:thiamine biosynthesis lipoprotein